MALGISIILTKALFKEDRSRFLGISLKIKFIFFILFVFFINPEMGEKSEILVYDISILNYNILVLFTFLKLS